MASGTFLVPTLPVTGADALSVDPILEHDGHTPHQTPGSVGVCLSGGGSRSLTASMGALLGLATVQVGPSNLLSQVKALSTVSGGSWLGTCWVYLSNDQVPDQAFLGGPYVEPSKIGRSHLKQLPAGCVADGVTHHFSLESLLLQGLVLKATHKGLPWHQMWQTLIGHHLLEPCGLYEDDENKVAADTFSFSDRTRADLVATNPDLGPVTFHLVASGVDRLPRPFPVCNFAVILSEPRYQPKEGMEVGQLAPVQTTPFHSGTLALPPGARDINGTPVGGGGVTSLAFLSQPVQIPMAGSALVSQPRQWALADCAGASSAAFAETLNDLALLWQQEPKRASKHLKKHKRSVLEWVAGHLPHKAAEAHEALGRTGFVEEVLQSLSGLVPQYDTWWVGQPVKGEAPNRFVDGGSLDNSGLLGLLAYRDIRSVLVFLNTNQPLRAGEEGCGIVRDGQVVPGTSICVTDELPTFFGYNPWKKDVGYTPLDPARPVNAWSHNQVFEPSRFEELLHGLWDASGRGANTEPALFVQDLAVRSNAWFGIGARDRIRVVWVHLNYASAWADALSPVARKALDKEKSFPHYDTFKMLELTPTQVALLANYTAWSVLRRQDAIRALFQD